MGMVIRGKRRYGGYIVHVGIVLMFVGFAGTAYKKERTSARAGRRGQDRQVHRPLRPPRARGGSPEGDGHRRGHRAGQDGKVIDHLRPAKWFFHNHESEPTTEVAIRRSPGRGPLHHAGRLRSRRGERDAQGRREPGRRLDLVRLHAAGDRDRHRAHPRLRARAADRPACGRDGAGARRGAGGADVCCWRSARAAVVLPRASARRRRRSDCAPADGQATADAPEPVGVDENWLVRNIMCQCGTCRHNLLECESDGLRPRRAGRIEIRQLLDQGKTREEVIQYFIKKYGSQIALASPIDKGFNRLAWLLAVQPRRGRGGRARLRRLPAGAARPGDDARATRAARSPTDPSSQTSSRTSSATSTSKSRGPCARVPEPSRAEPRRADALRMPRDRTAASVRAPACRIWILGSSGVAVAARATASPGREDVLWPAARHGRARRHDAGAVRGWRCGA